MAAAAACAPLPAGVAELHQAVLVGPHIVQVEHLWDMTITDEERRAPDRLPAQKRMLKVHLTDGHQRVCGIEYARIPQLAENMALGTTLVLHNVTVRCGLLFLTPSCVQVAGGAPGAAVATLGHPAGAQPQPPQRAQPSRQQQQLPPPQPQPQPLLPQMPLQPPQAAAAQPHSAPPYRTALQRPSAAAATAPPAFVPSVAPSATAAAAAAPSTTSSAAAAEEREDDEEEREDEEEVPLAARRRKLAKTSSPAPQATIFGKPSAPSPQLAVAAPQLQPGPAPPPSSGQYHDTPRSYPPGDPTAPIRHTGDPTAPIRHTGDPTAPMELHEACARHAAGELFEQGRARVLVRALSQRAARLSVQDEGYECELELRDSPRDGGAAISEFRCMLTLDPLLVESLFGAPTFHSRFQSEGL